MVGILGIDAANLRQGGGVTHLVEVLGAADPGQFDFQRIVVWASKQTLEKLPQRQWLECVAVPALEGGVLQRAAWQRWALSTEARRCRCDLLFVPGGTFGGSFRPFVAMSQNLLPFDDREISRYGVSRKAARLKLLRHLQRRTFRKASGAIFLTEFAKQQTLQHVGPLAGCVQTIPHGMNPAFFQDTRPQRTIESYAPNTPFRCVYVSAVSLYKHQWSVIEAISRLRAVTGWSIGLDLVGPVVDVGGSKMHESIAAHDPTGKWVRYRGAVPYGDLPRVYAEADLAIYASTCETFGQTLLEAMASALPVACSSAACLPELLGDAGAYFEAESPSSIAECLSKLIGKPSLRSSLAAKAAKRATEFSWSVCATRTFSFLSQVHQLSLR